MTYSSDLRSRVLTFIEKGGRKIEASRRFSVSRATVFNWLGQGDDHQPRKPGPKASRKFDQEALRQEVIQHPDRLLKELAKSRGVGLDAISRALKRMGFSRKKNAALCAKPAA